ncbi:MAG: DUF1989 domain-containing protein [Candidatus Kerfeldbacteria bacterium]|nr:DUF1989 domain-containing protein [Candidatus Kerfeldbacteria bacterium]
MTGKLKKLEERVLSPGEGYAFVGSVGDTLRIIDEEGQEVADLVAFNVENTDEKLSGPQTNKLNAHLNLKNGDTLYSTDCRPMFNITKISNPAVHYNFIFSPCGDMDNKIRFPQSSNGPTCLGALKTVLQPYKIDWRNLLEPFSMGLNLEIQSDGVLETRPPLSRAGDFIELHVMMKCIVAISACPQDRNLCNGGHPTPIRIQCSKGSVG